MKNILGQVFFSIKTNSLEFTFPFLKKKKKKKIEYFHSTRQIFCYKQESLFSARDAISAMV